MRLREAYDRLESLLSNPFLTIPIAALVTISLYVLATFAIKSPDVQQAAQLVLIAFGIYVVLQTVRFETRLKRYITRDLFTGFTSTRGLLIKHADIDIDPKDKEIRLGDRYKVTYRVIGKVLIASLSPQLVTPMLRIEPPFFDGDPRYSNQDFAVWCGLPTPIAPSSDGTWELQGSITFETSKTGPASGKMPICKITLSFEVTGETIFDIEIAWLPIHLMTRREAFLNIIKLHALKKLPPSYKVLQVYPQGRVNTNLVFLSGSLLAPAESNVELIRGVVAALARFVTEAAASLGETHGINRFELIAYDPQSYERELNSPDLIDRILTLTQKASDRPDGKARVAIYETHEFLMELEEAGGYGVCLFGFSPAPPNVWIIFDLSRLNDRDEVNSQYWIGLSQLRHIADSSQEYFETCGPNLLAYLDERRYDEPVPDIAPQPPQLLVSSRSDDSATGDIYQLLEILGPVADSCLRMGMFVNSEPAITRCWIDLDSLQDALTSDPDLKLALKESIDVIIDRCIEAYRIQRDHVSILNLCSEHSGIANELPAMWDYHHNDSELSCHDIGFDRRSREFSFPREITDPAKKREVILLVPVDSYVNTINSAIVNIRERENQVVCIIALFSVAEKWEYLSASGIFDIIPLFRVGPKQNSLTSLKDMTDYRRLRPWLLD